MNIFRMNLKYKVIWLIYIFQIFYKNHVLYQQLLLLLLLLLLFFTHFTSPSVFGVPTPKLHVPQLANS